MPRINHQWSTSEIQILTDLYPTGGYRAVQRLLPELSLSQIKGQAWLKGVKRIK